MALYSINKGQVQVLKARQHLVMFIKKKKNIYIYTTQLGFDFIFSF